MDLYNIDTINAQLLRKKSATGLSHNKSVPCGPSIPFLILLFCSFLTVQEITVKITNLGEIMQALAKLRVRPEGYLTEGCRRAGYQSGR